MGYINKEGYYTKTTKNKNIIIDTDIEILKLRLIDIENYFLPEDLQYILNYLYFPHTARNTVTIEHPEKDGFWFTIWELNKKDIPKEYSGQSIFRVGHKLIKTYVSEKRDMIYKADKYFKIVYSTRDGWIKYFTEFIYPYLMNRYSSVNPIKFL